MNRQRFATYATGPASRGESHQIGRRVGRAIVAAVLLAFAIGPGALDAATPTFGPGFPPREPDPGRSGLADLVAPLLSAVLLAVVVVGVLAVFVWLGRRLAGDTATVTGEPTTAGDRPLQTRDTGRRRLRPGPGGMAIWALAAGLGVLIGRGIASESSRGGLGGALGAGILMSGVAALVILVGLAGLVALGTRRGRATSGIVTTIGTSVLLALGAWAGHATAGVTGGTYREPVVLSANGRTEVTLTEAAFVDTRSGPANCSALADATALESVVALDLGRLGGATLRAMFWFDPERQGEARIELWIDGADLPEGAIQPFWGGSAEVVSTGADRVDGRIAFAGVARLPDGKAPDDAAVQSQEWPSTLSGEIAWACDPWRLVLPE